MPKRFSSWLASLVFFMSPACLAANIELVDDSGTTVRLSAPVQRIVSLAPNITELMFAAGGGSRLVGTVEYSDYPEAARRLSRIGSYARLDMETIVALKPDLVIAWQSGNPAGQIEQLRRLGLPVFLAEPKRIDDVARSLEQFGMLAGSEATGRAAATEFRGRVARLATSYSGRPTVRVFYQIWDQPPITINGQQMISDVLRLCGGENIFASLSTLAPTVSVEAVLAADPEAIVASGADASRPAWLDAWKRWPRLTAAARDNLYYVDPDLMQRQTPRVLDGAVQVCADLESARKKRQR
jgi:iron complex transport system substrate-binding protein